MAKHSDIMLKSERARLVRAIDELEAYLIALGKEIHKVNRELAEVVPTAKVFFKYVRCGTTGCHCQTGDGHGPYAYQSVRRGKRVKTHYLGRNPKLPEGSFDRSQYNQLIQRLTKLRREREQLYDRIERAIQLLRPHR
jgi:hypothetical protein